MSKYRRQHLVSEVILRRFADGQVIKVDLDSGQVETRNPATCMYENRFISAAPQEAEELWQLVENKLPRALAAVDDGSVLNDAVQAAAIRECMAMHMIRSRGIEWVAKKSTEGAIRKVREELLNNQQADLALAYLLRHHKPPPDLKALELIADELLAKARPALDDPRLFWDSVRMHFQTTLEWFAPLSLEISSPKQGAGEFLIGDSPTVPLKTGSLVGGPWGGVTLEEATTVVMPLGPHHMASLSRNRASLELDAQAVGYVNHVQIYNGFKEVCLRPGSGLEDLVRESLPKRPAKPLANS